MAHIFLGANSDILLRFSAHCVTTAPFSRCTMVNLSSRDVKQGLASYDEMCDLYMMYYVESNDENQLLEQSNFCWSQGPPKVSWHNLGLRNVPNILASSLP